MEKMFQIPTKHAMKQALIERVGADLQDKLASSIVAICGLGGLGSNIAICLARSGIGKLILIDFDFVELSNLNRQQYKVSQIGQAKTVALKKNLLEINPYLQIDTHNEYLTEANYYQLLAEANIVCEAFDQAEEKSKLANYVLEKMPDLYLVSASGMAGLASGNSIKTKRILSKFYLCGDQISEVAPEYSLFASRVMLCAAHQAQTVIRIIAEEFEV